MYIPLKHLKRHVLRLFLCAVAITIYEKDVARGSNDRMVGNGNITAYTEIRPHLVYLYSAVATPYTITNWTNNDRKHRPIHPRSELLTRTVDNNNYSSIILIGWEHISLKIKMATYECCILMKNGTIVKEKQYRKIPITFVTTNEPGFLATEFIFPFNNDYNTVNYVSMTSYNEKCPTESAFYLKPNFPEIVYRPGIAICSKVASHNLDPNYLIEWFEIQRFLGVDKVLAYFCDLEAKPMRVLKHYQSIGFLELQKFEFPDKATIPRDAGEAIEHWYEDETVTAYDCDEKLYNYQYAVILDKDEFIVPNTAKLQGSLPRFLDNQWKRNPKLGGLRFMTQIHNITGDHIASNRMMTSDCVTCSRPIADREFVHPKLAILHHYRLPRESYVDGMISSIDYPVTCMVMKELSNHVTNSTMKIRQVLGLNTLKYQ